MMALKRHVSNYPPTHPEALESYETGASLVEAFSNAQGQGGSDDSALVATLNALGLGGVSQEAAKIQRHTRRVDLEKRTNYHQARQQQKRAHSQYSKMLQIRQRLPAYAHEKQIVDTVAQSPVTIIQGETGCGKSTQVPQFILDANPTASIVVTQRTYLYIYLYLCSRMEDLVPRVSCISQTTTTTTCTYLLFFSPSIHPSIHSPSHFRHFHCRTRRPRTMFE
jgi:hypothetical protein